MKKLKKVLALVLVFCMVMGSIPATAFASTSKVDETLTASMTEAKTYIDGITINNSSNDPATVVKNFETHFTWDNEKRESSKSYLFDWSYYNGVVFEGLEYLYENTDDEAYKDYVMEYMSSLITSSGGWATCSNNSSKQCAGYNSTHGADCYKTASLLLDAYEMSGDNRYLTMAKTLYADLDTAAKSYSLANAGNNYRHTWASDPSPDLWLDGLYMILPFRAEYAKYTKDVEELDLIVERMQWVSDNMYNSSKGLFYHAADSASGNSGTYWLRSMGWYAAAIVDVMDSMEGENLETMKAQLKKFVDGMKDSQNSSNGMWLNNMNASHSSSNPYETSGTALTCYAVMKAVNNGWLDESYADMAILAFNGICEEKLSGSTLSDICFKGAPGSSNSTFYDNEGKGVGPFIMLYAEMQKYVNNLKVEKPVEPETPVVPEEPGDSDDSDDSDDVDNTVKVEDTVITVEGVTGLTGTEVKAEDKTLISNKEYVDFVAYDLTVDKIDNTSGKAVVSIPVPVAWKDAKEKHITGISVENGQVKEIKGKLEKGVYSFEVDHFSAKGLGLLEDLPVYDVIGHISEFVLDTNGMDPGIDNKYLIVGSDDDKALTLTGDTVGSKTVTVVNNTIDGSSVSDAMFYFKDNSSNRANSYLLTQNGVDSVYHTGGNMRYSTDDNGYWELIHNGEGLYQVFNYDNNTNWYLNYGYVWANDEVDRFSVSYATPHKTVRLFKETPKSDVRFFIESEEKDVAVGKTRTLYPRVQYDGRDINLNQCTIQWSSSDTSVATVNDGTVRGVALGDANIVATLSKVGNEVLSEPIKLVIPFSVLNRTVEQYKLIGNGPLFTTAGTAPDFNDVKLQVVYDNGNVDTIESNELSFSGYDYTKPGTYYVVVKYGGKKYGNVRLTVVGDPYAGLKEAENYPQYPEYGAVRIDKTATHTAEDFNNTGVTHIELDVAGISEEKPVDVVLVVDVSNSMAWSLENSSNTTEGNRLPTGDQVTKLDNAMEAASYFAEILLKDNKGNDKDNTLSFVTFAGYDKQLGHDSNDTACVDSVMGVFDSVTSVSEAKNSFEHTYFTSNDTSYKLQIAGTDGQPIVSGSNRGDTNYDYAFAEAEKVVDGIIENNGEKDRDVVVVFMTDGAPTHYNDITRRGKNARDDNAPSGVKYKQGNEYTNQNDWYSHFSSKPNKYAQSVYNKVDNMVSVGFDLANGGFSSWKWTEDELEASLKQVAHETKDIDVMTTANAKELRDFFGEIAHNIKKAGTQAKVTDIIDSKFTLQMASYAGSGDNKVGITPPSIAVSAHDLYTAKDDVNSNLIGERKGTYDVLEYVSFNEDGTAAYSDMVGYGETNIMTIDETSGEVTIDAMYFTYTKKMVDGKEVETFDWKIGDLTDKEVVLAFDAYLKGALEGEADPGTYYTNEEAILEYIDINGEYAKKIFPVPTVNWGGASTTARYYLVNENGEPVNYAGVVIPWANRIYVGDPVTIPLNLNDDLTIDNQMIKASAHVPPGYHLYDYNAYYEVETASGDFLNRGIKVSEPSSDAYKTLNGKTQSGAQTTRVIEAEEDYYTWSTVGFGVRFDMTPVPVPKLNPDRIVVDYGKDIQVNVLDNDVEALTESNKHGELIGFVEYSSNIDDGFMQSNIGTDDFSTENGRFTIENGKVNYKLNKMLSTVEKVFCVIKVTNKNDENDFHYRYNLLNIIPATTMYYETDFALNSETGANLVFETETTNKDKAWSTVTAGPDADGPQDDGTIGVDQTYGYDSTYENDSLLSNGSSMFVEGQGIANTTSKFTFTGTGFDLISRTGAAQGAIRVDIYSDLERKNKVKSVTVLNKSESDLELYQIPVVSVNDLDYGTYYVTVGVDAEYKNTTGIPALDALNRDNDFYFDAIRIFNPAKGNAEAENAYKADNEHDTELFEVRQQLIDAKDDEYDFTEGKDFNVEGVTFVDSTYKDGKPNHVTGNVSVGEYESIGPNNEVYLAKGQGIAFEIEYNENAPTSIDIGAKTITGKPVNMIAFTSPDGTQFEKEPVVINSSTAQFYKLVDKSNAEAFANSKKAYVFVTNVSEDGEDAGVLSITDVKVAYGSESATSEVSLLSNARTFAFAQRSMAAANKAVETADVVSLSTDKKAYTVGRTVKATVETNDAAEYVVVNGEKIDQYKEADGVRSWTYTKKAANSGNMTVTAVAYNGINKASEEVSTDVKVKRFAPKTFKVDLGKAKVSVGGNVKATVTTSSDVSYVTVNGKKVTKYTENKSKKKRTWLAEVKAEKAGKMTVDVVAYGAGGAESATKSKSLTVKK
ncbi:MAG: glycoside hydrolase family 88 protein [Eubacterium sp.]|nr:glycoside hydrolase family 88 protein [Eubacterium sp.]